MQNFDFERYISFPPYNFCISKLYNVPDIEDVRTTLKILEYLGCKIKRDKNKILINSKNLTKNSIPDELMRKLRSSVIVSGAILGRCKDVTFSYPRWL